MLVGLALAGSSWYTQLCSGKHLVKMTFSLTQSSVDMLFMREDEDKW